MRGLPSVWNSILFYVLMLALPIALFWPVFVRQWSRIHGSIDPLASPDLRLLHRMLCVLLAYVFLVGPEAFLVLARADVQYALSSAKTHLMTKVSDFHDSNGSDLLFPN